MRWVWNSSSKGVERLIIMTIFIHDEHCLGCRVSRNGLLVQKKCMGRVLGVSMRIATLEVTRGCKEKELRTVPGAGNLT